MVRSWRSLICRHTWLFQVFNATCLFVKIKNGPHYAWRHNRPFAWNLIPFGIQTHLMFSTYSSKIKYSRYCIIFYLLSNIFNEFISRNVSHRDMRFCHWLWFNFYNLTFTASRSEIEVLKFSIWRPILRHTYSMFCKNSNFVKYSQILSQCYMQVDMEIMSGIMLQWFLIEDGCSCFVVIFANL